MTTAFLMLAGAGWQERARALLDQLAKSSASFWWLLTHDTTSPAEKAVLIPYLLGAWFIASLMVSPLSLGLLKIFKTPGVDLRKVAGVNLGVAVTQVAFFAVDWYLMQWGNRQVDHGVFFATLVPAFLIAKWGLDISVGRAMLFTVAQAAFALGLIFVVVFALTATGHVVP